MTPQRLTGIIFQPTELAPLEHKPPTLLVGRSSQLNESPSASTCLPLVHMALATVVLSIQLSSSQWSTVSPYRPTLTPADRDICLRFDEEE